MFKKSFFYGAILAGILSFACSKNSNSLLTPTTESRADVKKSCLTLPEISGNDILKYNGKYTLKGMANCGYETDGDNNDFSSFTIYVYGGAHEDVLETVTNVPLREVGDDLVTEFTPEVLELLQQNNHRSGRLEFTINYRNGFVRKTKEIYILLH